MIQKKTITGIQLLGSIAIVLIIVALALAVIASIVTGLWNFVMPVLGLPKLTLLQGLALYLLAKVVTGELKLQPKSTPTQNNMFNNYNTKGTPNGTTRFPA